jgi:hypothetical protein
VTAVTLSREMHTKLSMVSRIGIELTNCP